MKQINDERISKNPIEFRYKNWKGKTSYRIVIPIDIWYGDGDFHKGRQWFLKAYDYNKDAERNFAIKDILEYIPHKEDWYKEGEI